MPAAGFYLMQRGWLDSGMFPSPRREPFCHRAAWAWLIEHAAHSEHAVEFRGRSMNLDRGQIATTHKMLGVAWGWNTIKVLRVMRAWQRAKAITVLTVAAGTLITVCNYIEYQDQTEPTVAAKRNDRSTDRYATVAGTKQLKQELESKEDSNLRSAPRGATMIDQDFEAWWKECPRKIAKGAGLRAYRTARKSAEVVELLDGIKAYAASRAGEDAQFTTHPATWLNGKRWLDQPGESIERHTGPTGPPPPLVQRIE